MNQPKNPITQLKRRLVEMKQKLPPAVGLIAKSHFEGNFRGQGFDNQKWAEVQRRIPETNAYKYATKAQRTSAILSGKTKLLAKSIYVKSATWKKIVIASSSKYGKFINEGTPIMPQRKFMGFSVKLNKKILSFVKKQADKVFKG
jgi:phage gpG-like protein